MQNNSPLEKKVLENLRITALNEIQQASLKATKKGRDMVLLSPTGSGKTLAFLLPILNSLDPKKEGVQAMVLAPARELALQIEQVFRKMGTGYKVNCCYGGHSIRIEKNNLLDPPAVLIGTPGRIADHIKRERIDTSSIQTLVLDEFDKALEFGFKMDMSFILGETRRLQRRILTSATPLLEIPKFTGIKDPVELNFLKDDLPAGLTLKAVVAEGRDKLDALYRLICTVGYEPTLVFCNHREAVERISDLLRERNVVHDIFHGGLEQDERERALIKFRNGSLRLLITTDLASRGLDIPEIKNVIHYQMPSKEEPFVHRNGRTARMNAKGNAFLVMGEGEKYFDYITDEPQIFRLEADLLPPGNPEWATLYIGGGKKDKINKIDIVGLLCKKGNLQKDEMGLIEVCDYSAFVAVKRDKIENVVQLLRNERIKRKKAKLAISN